MAKSKRSKHMRAMRKLLRDKLSKKDEVKRLASLKNDKLIPSTLPIKVSPIDEEMQVGIVSEFNSRTLKDKHGQFPSWLSGRQRKRLQSKHAIQKRIDKKKTLKKNSGRTAKGRNQQKNKISDKSEIMLT